MANKDSKTVDESLSEGFTPVTRGKVAKTKSGRGSKPIATFGAKVAAKRKLGKAKKAVEGLDSTSKVATRAGKNTARQAKASTMRGNLGETMKSMQQTMYPTKKGDKDSGLSFEQRNFNALVDALTMRRSKKK